MIKDFLRYGIEVEGQSGQVKTVCPKCSHTRSKASEPCLSVNITTGIWNCWHCGWTGCIKKEMRVSYEDFKPINQVKSANTPDGLDWLRQRGISQDTVEKMKVVTAYKTVGGKKQEVIAFAYYVGDKIVNYKFRSVDGKMFNQSVGENKKSIFYNLNNILFTDVAIITEGEIDAMSFYEAGMQNVISVPNGAPNPGESGKKRFDFIGNSYEFIKHIKKFYLAVDNDTNGRILRDELAARLGKGKCMIIEMPSDCKDANDVLMKYGAEALVNIIESAEPYPVDGVFSVYDVKEEIMQYYTQGLPKGYRLGICGKMDDNFMIFPGQLCVITGIPNHGKSPLLDQICVNFAEKYGIGSVMFSPENGKVSIHSMRLVRQYARKNFLPEFAHRMSELELKKAMEFINNHIYFVYPKDNAFTLDKILDNFSYISGKYGVKVFVIDPWNTIEHHIGDGESETTYIAKVLNRLKYFAREHDGIFFVISHPTKMQKNEKTGLHYPPDLYSISGSAHWYNVPDCGMTIYRRYSDRNMIDTKWTELYVNKVKFDFMGRTSMYYLDFEIASQRFKEAKEQNNYGIPSFYDDEDLSF